MPQEASLITLEKFLEEADPGAFEKVVKNSRPPGPPFEDGWGNSPQRKRHGEAEARCRQVLLEAFAEGELEVYGRRRGDPTSRFAVLDLDLQRAVLEGWKYDPQWRPLGQVYLPDYGNMPVRVRRRHVVKMGTAKAETDCTKWLEESYQAWIEEGEPPGMTYEEWIEAERPTTRLSKDDRWRAADDEFNEVGSARLYRTGFDRAWEAAEIPLWKLTGKIPRAPKNKT